MVNITPVVYLSIFLILSIILHLLIPVNQLITSFYRLIGLIPLGIGIWLNIWTDRLFSENETSVKPTDTPSEFITNGPFRISRHPMYLGMFLIMFGVAIVLGSLTAFLPALGFFAIMDYVFISYEEQQLKQEFNDEFSEYRNRVRRWF